MALAGWAGGGCHDLFGYAPAAGTAGSDAAADDGGVARDGTPIDALAEGPAPTDAALALVVTASGASVRVGQSTTATLTASAPGETWLKAPPCRLKLAGPGRSWPALKITLPAPGGAVDLEVFAPLAAAAGKQCQLVAKDAAVVGGTIDLLSAETAIIDLDGFTVVGLSGLEAKILGQLPTPHAAVRAMATAGGGFGERLMIATSLDRGTPVSSSSVRIFDLQLDAPTATIGTWLDLSGDVVQPGVIDDLVWSDIGPCPGQLYVAADQGDLTPANDDIAGGIYCIDETGSISELVNRPALTLDVAARDGIMAGLAEGGIVYSRSSGTTIYPGQIDTPPAYGGFRRLRLVTGASHLAGALFGVAYDPNELQRVGPAPAHQQQSLGLVGDKADLAVAPAGELGGVVLVAREETEYRIFSVLALIEQAPGTWLKVSLLEHLTCARRLAVDTEGQRLFVAASAPGDTGCTKTTIYELSFTASR